AVVLPLGHQTVLVGRHNRNRELLLDSASSGDTTRRPQGQHLVSEIPDVRIADVENLKEVPETRQEGPDAVRSHETTLQRGGPWLEHHLRAEPLSRRIKVASVERVGPFQKSIHVLLRHRPRIISPRSPLHAKHDYCFSSKAALPAVAPVSPAPCV